MRVAIAQTPASLARLPSQLMSWALNFGLAHDLDQRHVALQSGDDRAVLGQDVLDEVHGDDRPGAVLVLNDEAGPAGNVAAHVPGEHARIGVVSAAGAGADG